jgi:hypothetical protein
MATQKKWQLSGDYFENCNCNVVCPCLVSTSAPLTARPSQGVCDVALVFHIDKGSYDDVALDGLNVAVIVHTPGPMADGNWTLAAYIDERANDSQTALGRQGRGFVPPDPDGKLHESLTRAWYLAEYVPKPYWDGRTTWRANHFQRRAVPERPIVHDAAWLRSGGSYATRLPADAVRSVCGI